LVNNDNDDFKLNDNESLIVYQQEETDEQVNLSKSIPSIKNGPPKLKDDEKLTVTFSGQNPTVRSSDNTDILLDIRGYGVQKIVRLYLICFFKL
jgi:hypothetical protein